MSTKPLSCFHPCLIGITGAAPYCNPRLATLHALNSYMTQLLSAAEPGVMPAIPPPEPSNPCNEHGGSVREDSAMHTWAVGMREVQMRAVALGQWAWS